MCEEVFVRECSPTLANMKAGNMFSSRFNSFDEVSEYAEEMNQMLNPKGMQVIILRYNEGLALIGVFRIRALKEILKNKLTRQILTNLGYKKLDLHSCLVHLLVRFQNFNDFPHEVGLFLGYPPEDVQGFIQNNSNGQKCIGIWKVYGDEKSAQKTFEKYRKCTRIFCSLLKKGRSIDKLAVAG